MYLNSHDLSFKYFSQVYQRILDVENGRYELQQTLHAFIERVAAVFPE